MAKLGSESLNDLSAGAVFLATGGGGDPYVHQLIAQQALDTYGPVELLDPDDLDDDAFVSAPFGRLGFFVCVRRFGAAATLWNRFW